jgi:lipopolysaccharide export system permease protein
MKRIGPRTVFRVIAWGTIEPFLLLTAAFALIYMLTDAADRFGAIAGGNSVLAGIEYLLLRVPGNLSKLLPAALMAGVMFGFARMNRSGEIVAMQSLGISRLQMAVPLAALAVLITLGDFILSETVVPTTNSWSQTVLNARLRRRRPARSGAAWIRTRDAFVFAAHYDPSRKELEGLTIVNLSDNATLRSITQAERALWTGRGWSLVDARSVSLGPDNLPAFSPAPEASLRLVPEDLAAPFSVNPEDLSLSELNRFIRSLERRGLNPRRYLNLRELKYSLPFSCIVLAAMGLALSLDPLPRHAGYARNIAMAMTAGCGYWLMLAVTMSFGKSGLLLPWMGAWLPNITFGGFALGRFLTGEEQ